MSSYPERRPYATTVPHSGYRAKPFIPQPPAEALAILRSHVGYDDLRRDASDEAAVSSATATVRTAAGRTYHSSPAAPSVQRLLPLTERSPQEALAAAQLQSPIEHGTRDYHGCQQPALNAELREKVVSQGAAWSLRLAEAQGLLSTLPVESALAGRREAEALQRYLTAYRCTEDMPVSEEDLVAHCGLRTPMAEVETLLTHPAVPSDTMRRALDDLLRSPYLLAPLDGYAAKLAALDRLGGLAWSGEGSTTAAAAEVEATGTPSAARSVDTQLLQPPSSGEAGADVGGVVASSPATAVCPSRVAVALHEQLHFNPGDYAARELKRSEDALAALQQRVQAAKRDKEAAIDAQDPITALRSLHAQVDLSNDLLVLYKARLGQVGLHSEDAQEFRREVVQLIDDARQAAGAVREYARKALPSVHHDVSSTADGMEASEKTLKEAQRLEGEAEAQMRDQLNSVDSETRELWQQVLALMEQIASKAQERTHVVRQCMSRREQRAKAVAQEEALLAAQAAHCERLRQCEEVLARWEEVGNVYAKYVEACVPKLLQHLAAVEDSDEDLSQREAEGYVAMFEQFVYAAEEARAKRRTQADRMRLLQRSVELSHERAEETLDPDAAAHTQRREEAVKELEEVQLYLQYLDSMEEERRAEVDPVLRRVLVRHAASQGVIAAAAAAAGEAEQAGADGATATAVSATPPLQVTEAGEKEEGEAVQTSQQGSKQDSRTNSLTSPPSPPPPPPPVAPAAADVVAAPRFSADSPPPALGMAEAVVVAVPADSPPATMTHPLVAARQVGLEHEGTYLMKQALLTERELLEVEAKRTGVRHSKEELRAMENKYQNGDAIRELLGLF